MERAPLDVPELDRLVADHPVWSSIEVRRTVGSTNTVLADLAVHGGAAGTVLTAEQQTAGRGRADRTWISPPRAGLAVSMLLRPSVAPARWSWLPLLAGVAACEAVASAAGEIAVALKWPNDLLGGPHYRKLAGILAEVRGPAVVLGVGLNVSVRRDELPRDDTTSLDLETVDPTDRTRLLSHLLERVGHWYTVWQDADGDPRASGLASAYRARCHTVGRQVTVSLPDGSALRGRAVDVDDIGRLCVDTGTVTVPVAAGDVEHVRLEAGCESVPVPGDDRQSVARTRCSESAASARRYVRVADGRGRGARPDPGVVTVGGVGVADGHALSALGLSAVEESAYRALLGLPDTDVSCLAGRLSVSVRTAEVLLTELTKRGLARMVADGRYTATPPESSIVHILADRLDALRRGYDAVGELEQAYRDSRARYGRVPETETVRGPAAMASRLEQLQDRAREEVRILVRPPMVTGDAVRAGRRATDRGVRYRTLFQKSMLADSVVMTVVRQALGRGVAVRLGAELPLELVVVDGHVAFIVEPGDHEVALVTEHPALLVTAVGLFEQLWSTAVPVPARDGDGARSGPLTDPEDRLLLSLLLAGLTDQAIAARLGVGLRTVQRRVRDLMDAAEVDTRIQLGWQAGRKGWV